MKKGFIIMLAAVAFVAFSFTSIVKETYTANVSKSEINWRASKVTGKHNGNVVLKNGNLDFSDGVLTGGSFTIDMTTIDVLDLEGEWKGKLVNHLKSADFFNVENYPTANFKITNVVPKGTPGDFKITGDLTIKGITKSIKFYANVAEMDGAKVSTATIELDRTDFDVRYGSGSFFDGLGDKTIYDDFELDVKLVSEK